MLSGSEIRRSLIQGLSKQRSREVKGELTPDQIAALKEVQSAIRSMTETKGWRLVEEWMTRRIDFFGIIYEKDKEAKNERELQAKAYAELLAWVDEMSKTEELEVSNG